MATSGRTRTWACISYKSLDEIEQVLKDLHVPAAYQLHDKDDKPPHTHIIIQYGSVKSLDQTRNDLKNIAANGYVEPVRDTRGAIRYLSHIDSPEKTRYDIPKAINWDISKYYAEQNPSINAVKNMKEITKYILQNDISYYNQLLDLLEADKLDALYAIAINRRYIQPILAYLKAKDTQEQREARLTSITR